jgi:cobalt-zinc-cadmium efflux system protein
LRPAWLTNPLLVRLAAFVLGALFLYASHDKILHPREFARIVYHYRLIGPSHTVSPVIANTFAVTLPWVEALTGLLLVVGLWRREAAVTTAVMLVMFLVAVGWAMSQGIDVEKCGCFTVSGEGRAAGWKLVAEDAAMLAAAVWIAWASPAAKPASRP